MILLLLIKTTQELH